MIHESSAISARAQNDLGEQHMTPDIVYESNKTAFRDPVATTQMHPPPRNYVLNCVPRPGRAQQNAPGPPKLCFTLRFGTWQGTTKCTRAPETMFYIAFRDPAGRNRTILRPLGRLFDGICRGGLGRLVQQGGFYAS